jgi:mono/diheme cytochrome c family protein
MFKYILFSLILVFIITSFSNQISRDFEKKDIKELGTVKQNNIQTAKQAEEGKDIYQKHCLSCHQVNGSGVPNMIPPLQQSDWINGDKKRLISVLLNGLQGEIVVNEDIYRQAMPKQDYLTDEQIAKVLTFIRQNFENEASPVKPGEVSKMRPPKPK